jgi:hypothetical protein
MSDRATTKTLLDLLERHYLKPGPMPGGVFIRECGLNGGTGAGNRVDALYAGFTSTSGRLLIGHEVKASRADWRKELDSLGKADQWADNCHAWYIVAPSTDIVPPEELPPGWGLMLPGRRTKTRMEVKVKAQHHAERIPDWTTMRSILARLDTLHWQEQATFRQRIEDEARKTIDGRVEQALAARDRQTLTDDQRDRLNWLDRLEQKIGPVVSADRWDDYIRPEHVAAGAAVAKIGLDRYGLEAVRAQAQRVMDACEEFERVKAEHQETLFGAVS